MEGYVQKEVERIEDDWIRSKTPASIDFQVDQCVCVPLSAEAE